MREILFKAKRLDNGEWVEGCIIRHEFDNRVYIGYVFEDMQDGFFDTDLVQVDPETLCQFTGLTDSNRKKVFEGDIIKFFEKNERYEWTGRVEFGNPNGRYTWGWQLVWISGEKPSADTLLWFDMEESGAYSKVIGNIHDKEEPTNEE